MAKAQGFLDKIYPWILTVGGAIGLWAAFRLTVEKMALLENPSHIPSCDINPIVSCGSVIKSAQGEAFGFPNPWLGLIGFTAVLVVGVSLLAGANNLKKWFWQAFYLGTLAGVVFVHWLIFQTVYRLGALCPYCMVVWTVTIPIFWYSSLYMARHGYLKPATGRVANFLQANHFTLLMLWFLAILGIITQHFWYYIQTVI